MTQAQPADAVRHEDSVLLVADPPPERPRSPGTSPAGRHEALITMARAVFAAGGRITVPADAGVSMLLATVALEYTRFDEAAGSLRPARLIVMESGPAHRAARSLLAPFVLLGVVDYRDAGFTPIIDATATSPVDVVPAARPRQRVTPELIAAAGPFRAAVLISSARESISDLAVLRAAGVTTTALRESAHDAQIEEELGDVDDPSDLLVSDDIAARPGEGDRPLREDPERGRASAPPYSYVAQRFVSDRFGRDDLGRNDLR